MRVLFTAYAVRTHFYSMVPLARALEAAGHEVRVASQPELVPEITRAGLTAVAVGRDHGMWRVLKLRHGSERWAALPPFDVAGVSEWEGGVGYLRAGYADVVPWWFRLVNDPMADDLVALCRSWEPDLVVWEPGTFVGAVAARVCGAAHARMTWGVDFFARTREQFLRLRAQDPQGPGSDPLGEWLAGLAGRFGVEFDEELTTGQFTLDQLPEAFRLETSVDYVPVRYGIYNGPSVVERWLWERPARPRIGFTLGLSAVERLAGYAVSVPEILEALSQLDVEVVAAVRGWEGPAPRNVRVTDFVPLAALVPTCRVMVHHGGFGTIGTTALHATPQLLLAEELDAPILASRVAAYGAGISLPVEGVSGKAVVARVERLLEEPSFTAGARRLQADLHAMPSPAAVVGRLVELTAHHRGR
ncbi:activator-dependent family glycosyltransferase [Streptomyces cyaneofuscatus]